MKSTNKFNLVILGLCSLVLLVTIPLVGACAKPTPTQIELNSVSFLPEMAIHTKNMLAWHEVVNQRTNGEITIRHRGGPEVIPATEQALAVQAGTIDLAYLPAPFYIGLVPEVAFLHVSRLGSLKEREAGLDDILGELHEEAGLIYLGRSMYDSLYPMFYIYWGKDKVTSLDGLKGKMIGVGTTLGRAGLRALDTAFTLIPIPEAASALERGVIDAFVTTQQTGVIMGVHEAAKYVTDHPFLTTNTVAIMNPSKWKQIPERLQKIIKETLYEEQVKWGNAFLEQERVDREKIIAAGAEFVKFSPAEGQQFIETIYRNESEFHLKNNPEHGPEIVKMLKLLD